jgi:hypothetical protein
MNGIILYADDDVLNVNSFENKLFSKFNNQQDYSILPITTIRDLEATVNSVSTIRALLLDWEFKRPKEDDDLPDKNENPLNFLRKQKIYSLIYIYSRTKIPDEVKKELADLHGENRVFFVLKSSKFDEDSEYKKIRQALIDFDEKNKHMELPFLWSQSINQSVQSIFSELESADPNWIQEIRDTAKNDGGEPTSEVIDIFHNLLNESIIQNKTLRDTLDNYNCKNKVISEENTAKLYQRIFYTKIANDAPIMTGDIFKFNDNEYGILITPECDLSNKEKDTYEFLIIKKDSSNKYQKDKRGKYKKDQNAAKQIFNNGVISRHLLISFPFDDNTYDNIALIEFCSAMYVCKHQEQNGNCIISNRTSYKLNSPYIHQLRQRFVAFFGRYGVPAIPNSLRNYNLQD